MTAYTLTRPENLQELAANISLPFAQNLVAEWVARLTTDNNLLFIDFESYYDDDYNLSKFTNYDYIAHEFFKLHSVSYVRGRDPDVKLVWGHQESLDAIQAEITANPNTVIVAQNTMFDGTVLTKNSIIPRHFLDIMGMSRAWFKQQLYHNLNAILERLFPDDPTMRKSDGLNDTKGIRVLNEMLQGVLGPYNIRDVELLRAAFYEFMRLGFPKSELPVLDLTLQMSCVPRFMADVPLLETTRDAAQKNQQEKVAAALEFMRTNGSDKFNPIFFCSADSRNKAVWKTKKAYNEDYRDEFGMGPTNKDDEAIKFLSSNQKFEYVLTHKFGVKVPMKESPTAKKRGDFELIPALGINDVEFQELMAERRDLHIIWEGRIASKSNIEYTRAVTLMRLAEIFDGHIILPIKYSAAHTDRFGGGDGVNPQNFTRGGNHRKSLRAQEGMTVHVRDSSNVELRMSAAFCEHHEKLELFRQGGDPYITMANKIFGYMCNKHDHPTERGVGKATELGCGYGMGRDRFRNYLNAGPLGMPPTFLEDIPALAGEVNPYLTVVNAYREQNWPIPEMWRKLERVLMDMTYEKTDTTLGPLRITFERMTGPNGLSLQYPQLGYRNKQWSYLSADGWTNLFGGKVLENIIQFLSRIGICDQMVMIAAMAEYLGGRCVLQVHDEIVTLIWDEITDKFDDFANEVMHANLPWMPTCPLASEADIGPTYS